MTCLKHAINNWPCAFTSEIFTKHKAVKGCSGHPGHLLMLPLIKTKLFHEPYDSVNK